MATTAKLVYSGSYSHSTLALGPLPLLRETKGREKLTERRTMSSSVYVSRNKMGKVAMATQAIRRHFNKILVIVSGSIFFSFSKHILLAIKIRLNFSQNDRHK